MAGKKTRSISKLEFEQIIATIKSGFTTIQGEKVRPNNRIATALVLEANLGLRIGDIVKLRLSDIIYESDRYHLDIVEEKTGKKRTFTMPHEIYIYLQNYALSMGIGLHQRLFSVSVRAIQNHLQMACDSLGIVGVGSHSFRKFFAMSIYNENDFNVELVRTLLQHSSVAVTQHYLSVEPRLVENALQKHIVLPA